jgi:hypothetical protein
LHGELHERTNALVTIRTNKQFTKISKAAAQKVKQTEDLKLWPISCKMAQLQRRLHGVIEPFVWEWCTQQEKEKERKAKVKSGNLKKMQSNKNVYWNRIQEWVCKQALSHSPVRKFLKGYFV